MFWHLFGTFGLLVLCALGIVGWLVLGRMERHALDHVQETLWARAILVAEAVRDAPVDGLQPRIQSLGRQVATRITLLGEDGAVLADSEQDPHVMERHDRRPEVLEARHAPFGTSSRFSTTLGQPMMYGALHLTEHRGRVAFVRVALPLAAVQVERGWLQRVVWTAAAATGLASLLLAFWLAGRMSRPLRDLTAGAERLAGGQYGHMVDAGNRGEVGMLARSFNRMSQRLSEQFTELEQDRQQLRTILSGMVEGVVALSADQRILFANERAGQLLEFAHQPAVGRKLWEVVRQRSLHEIVRRCLSNPDPTREDLAWNGRAVRNLAVHAVRLSGTPERGVVLVLHDTSELRRLERLRQDFVANVSHELKTPLAVIKACVETLLDGALEDLEHRRGFVQQVDEQAERLHALILDLLSLSRIEAGTEAFAFGNVAVGKLVSECLERHRARAEGKGQFLEALPPAKEVTAWADEEAVGHILENLIDNALKYTPKGGHIQVRWRSDDGHVALEVEDTGIGIPEADLPRVFERFYRVDRARSRELGGTGLGLSIVKHLAQAMHGGVEARSQVGQGTTFAVYLPGASG